MSLKLRLLYFHLNIFLFNLDTVSDEPGVNKISVRIFRQELLLVSA